MQLLNPSNQPCQGGNTPCPQEAMVIGHLSTNGMNMDNAILSIKQNGTHVTMSVSFFSIIVSSFISVSLFSQFLYQFFSTMTIMFRLMWFSYLGVSSYFRRFVACSYMYKI